MLFRSNRIINRLGLIHPFELAEEDGCSLADLASAFVIAERLFDLRTLWDDIEKAKLSETARLALFDRVASAVRAQMADILRAVPAGTLPADGMEMLANGVANLAAHVDSLLIDEAKHQCDGIVASLVEKGAAKALALRVAALFKLDGAVGLSHLARQLKIDEIALTRAFVHLGHEVGIDWVQAAAARMEPSDPWEWLLISGVAREDRKSTRLNSSPPMYLV